MIDGVKDDSIEKIRSEFSVQSIKVRNTQSSFFWFFYSIRNALYMQHFCFTEFAIPESRRVIQNKGDVYLDSRHSPY